MQQTNSTAPAEIPVVPSIGDIIDNLCKAQSIIELVFMAGDSLRRDMPDAGDAIAAGCDLADTEIRAVKASLYAILGKGGAV